MGVEREHQLASDIVYYYMRAVVICFAVIGGSQQRVAGSFASPQLPRSPVPRTLKGLGSVSSPVPRNFEMRIPAIPRSSLFAAELTADVCELAAIAHVLQQHPCVFIEREACLAWPSARWHRALCLKLRTKKSRQVVSPAEALGRNSGQGQNHRRHDSREHVNVECCGASAMAQAFPDSNCNISKRWGKRCGWPHAECLTKRAVTSHWQAAGAGERCRRLKRDCDTKRRGSNLDRTTSNQKKKIPLDFKTPSFGIAIASRNHLLLRHSFT